MYSTKKFHETYSRSSNIVCQEKITDWILRVFTFNDKNPLYLSIILTLSFFEGESDQGVIKALGIQNIKNSEFKIKKTPGFFKGLFIFYLIF